MTTKTANSQHVVVDGSNIATEGRSMPSLAQLNEAVNSYIADHPGVRVTVVVDATFGHRIASSEVKEFDAAIANNELVAPPAGAIGRGDAFVLSIAKKAKATILSNDSFQEFHGEHDWLFDDGRLVGGKPVPHVGWVWVARSPVRGPVSRKAVRASNAPTARAAKADREPTTGRGSSRRASKEATAPMPVPTTPPPGRAATRDVRSAAATPPAPPSDVVNELMPFLDFVQHHPVGTSVNAIVDSYSSHGAYVKIGDVFGYVPLRLMSEPPPRSAREVMKVGDAVTLVVASFAPARRSIDCAVPNMAFVVEPQDGEAVAAEAAGAAAPSAKKAARKSTAKKVAASPAKTPAKKVAQPRATKKSATTPKTPAKDVEPPASEPVSKKATAAAPPAKKAAPRASSKRTSTRTSTRPATPADEVVSPEARARRRGPRTSGGAPDPSSELPAPPPPTGPDAPPVTAGSEALPRTRQPRQRRQIAEKVTDA
ncbi:MAG TPA: S1 RNA-binding domain-containing protein [Ilumatobacteraceae bacterium]|nr:S1 RNA-binding domain-containing protein [Ilumatobacteraceae bacterium]